MAPLDHDRGLARLTAERLDVHVPAQHDPRGAGVPWLGVKSPEAAPPLPCLVVDFASTSNDAFKSGSTRGLSVPSAICPRVATLASGAVSVVPIIAT